MSLIFTKTQATTGGALLKKLFLRFSQNQNKKTYAEAFFQ